MNKEIEVINNQIIQGESDLKTNQFQFSEEQLKEKARVIISLKKDKKNAKEKLDMLEKLNQNSKLINQN